MRLCQIVPSLEEKHGGPSKSVYAISRALAHVGHDVSLLATHPAARSGRQEDQLRVEIFRRGRPHLFGRSSELRSYLRPLDVDVVHHHSIWLRTLHYAHQHAAKKQIPLVISPRGMMSNWAWHHHAGRKQLARQFVHPGAFEAAAGWHATSEDEARDIRRLGFTQAICVASNGVNAPSKEERATALEHWQRLCPEITRRRTALFYSRFHRKKRVLELIDLWLQHAPADWILLMVGLPDDYMAAQLKSYVMRASGGGRVQVFDGRGRPAPYAAASLFLLPSHSENFGQVIAEAMANRLPVVVTDATPWGEVNNNSGGWCVPWEHYDRALAEALATSEVELAFRGQAAQAYALAGFSWESSATKLQDFYRELLTQNAKRSDAPVTGK